MITFDDNCFIDPWDDETQLQQTINTRVFIHTLFDSNTDLTVNYIDSNNIDEYDNEYMFNGKYILLSFSGSSYLFSINYDIGPIGSGSFGDVYTLFYCDNYMKMDNQDWWVCDNPNWVDIGLAVKEITFPVDVALEKQALINRSNIVNNCCMIKEIHLYGEYFMMQKVDGDLNQFFQLYTPSLLNHESDTYFMQKFTIQMIDRLKSMFGCIYDSGYQYFDIKTDNIGYRIVQNDNGNPRIQLFVLDIGSLVPGNSVDKNLGAIPRSYTLPEWRAPIGERMLLFYANKNELVRKGYVWYMGRLLFSMFMYHDVFGESVRTLDNDKNDYVVSYVDNQSLSDDKYPIVRVMKLIFPPDTFPGLYTTVLPYPFRRDLDLNDSWITYKK